MGGARRALNRSSTYKRQTVSNPNFARKSDYKARTDFKGSKSASASARPGQHQDRKQSEMRKQPPLTLIKMSDA